MTFEFITYEKADHVATITINRPEVMNALHPPAHEELESAWNDVASDASIWVAILTGGGRGCDARRVELDALMGRRRGSREDRVPEEVQNLPRRRRPRECRNGESPEG